MPFLVPFLDYQGLKAQLYRLTMLLTNSVLNLIYLYQVKQWLKI